MNQQGDTIYAVDRVSEELLVELFEHESWRRLRRLCWLLKESRVAQLVLPGRGGERCRLACRR